MALKIGCDYSKRFITFDNCVWPYAERDAGDKDTILRIMKDNQIGILIHLYLF